MSAGGYPGLPQAARDALAGSFLASLAPDVLDVLLADALELDVPAGSTFYHAGSDPRAGLVVSGLVRVYMTAPAGRQVTVRYARAGDAVGIAALVGGPAEVSVQALTDATLLMLNIRALHALGRVDARIGWLVAEEVTRRLYDTLDALAGNVFGSVRQRIARHLLDLAATQQQDRALMARVSQQELADAVGSVREVVTRVLRGMREDGLVRTGPDGIHLLDAAGLHATAWTATR